MRFDRPRGPIAARVGVHDQRDHHRRIKRRPSAPISAVGGIERFEIHRLDRVENEPREVVGGMEIQLISYRGRVVAACTPDNYDIDTGAMAAVLIASAIATWTVREPALATVLSRLAAPAACLAAIVFAPLTSVIVLPIAVAPAVQPRRLGLIP
jgi:hypothetical protein